LQLETVAKATVNNFSLCKSAFLLATLSNCGKPLKPLTPSWYGKPISGLWETTGYGNSAKDRLLCFIAWEWAIRSEAPDVHGNLFASNQTWGTFTD